MQSYPVALKNVIYVPKTLHLYPNGVSMQIWSKYIDLLFRQNADKFLFTVGGVFWYRF